MILDNENSNLKVHEWLAKYTDEGKLDIVTGYISMKVNKTYRSLLGKSIASMLSVEIYNQP